MDYKEMYLEMMRASEAAIRILVEAQQKCEEMYVDAKEEPVCSYTHDPAQ